MTLYDYIALTILALVFAIAWRSLNAEGRAVREARSLRVENERLMTLFEWRHEKEELALAQSWCEGWNDREAFEECLRVELGASVAGYAKGLAN